MEREVGPNGETYVIYYAFLDNLPDSYKVTLGGNVIKATPHKDEAVEKITKK